MALSRSLIGASLMAGLFIAGSTHSQPAQPPAPLPAYRDATATNVPIAPDLHGLDAAVADVDGDGDLDVAIAVEMGLSRLYLNDGTGKLTWKQGVFGWLEHDNEHVRFADLDKDGHVDVVFASEEDQRNQIFLGDGKANFRDVSDRLPHQSQGNGLEIGDVNGDGLPDIVIGNTDEPPRLNPGPVPNPHISLFLNDPRNPGHFIDASANVPASARNTQGIALADLDKDGDLDMVLANQDPPNVLLFNDGKGKFTDVSDRMELKVPLETREVHVFDANGDGHLDFAFFNLSSNAGRWDKDPQTRLLINDGKGRWKDETATRFPPHQWSSWAAKVVDFNYDGAPDLLVGSIAVPGLGPRPLRAWKNDGKGHFTDVTESTLPPTMVGRNWSMGSGDLDGDGKTDVVVGGWGTQVRLLLTRNPSWR